MKFIPPLHRLQVIVQATDSPDPSKPVLTWLQKLLIGLKLKAKQLLPDDLVVALNQQLGRQHDLADTFQTIMTRLDDELKVCWKVLKERAPGWGVGASSCQDQATGMAAVQALAAASRLPIIKTSWQVAFILEYRGGLATVGAAAAEVQCSSCTHLVNKA